MQSMMKTRSATLVPLLTAALWLLTITAGAFAQEAPAVTVTHPGGVEEYRANQQAIFESLTRDAHLVDDAIVASPSAEQLESLRTQGCDDCPGGQARFHLAGVAVPVGTVVDLSQLTAGDIDNQGRREGSGIVRRAQDDLVVWTATVATPGAEQISVTFSGLDLPHGVELYVYTAAGAVDGPYTRDGGLGTGSNWTNPLSGDELAIELRIPAWVLDDANSLERLQFTIESVNHLGDGTLGGPRRECPELAECIESAECFTSQTFGHIENLRRAVASILFQDGSSFGLCSGGLVSNRDGHPFFLTANHCFASQTVASSARFFWDYRMEECGANACLNPDQFPNQQGAQLLFTSPDQDVTLVNLAENPPGERVFLGWNTTAIHTSDGTALHRIHHPQGAPQMYTQMAVNTTSDECGGLPRGDYIYSDPVIGATDGGSSGSPVVNANNQIVGQLFGACGPNPEDPCADNQEVDGAFAASFASLRRFLMPATEILVPGNFGDITTDQVFSGVAPGQTGLYVAEDRRLVQVDTFADPIRRRRVRGIITVHSIDENGQIVAGRTVELPTKGRSRLIVRERGQVTFDRDALEVTNYTFVRNHRGSFRIQGRNPAAGRVTIRANTRASVTQNNPNSAPTWNTRVTLRNLENVPGRRTRAVFVDGFREQYFSQGYLFGFNREQLQARPRGNTFAGSGVVRDLTRGGEVIAPNSRINIRLGNPQRTPHQPYRVRMRLGGPRGAGFLGNARERGYVVPVSEDFVGVIPTEPIFLPGDRVQNPYDYGFGPLFSLDPTDRKSVV